MRSRRAPRLAFCLIYDLFTGDGEGPARAEFAGAPTAMKGNRLHRPAARTPPASLVA
jgi:hypothetical protein